MARKLQKENDDVAAQAISIGSDFERKRFNYH